MFKVLVNIGKSAADMDEHCSYPGELSQEIWWEVGNRDKGSHFDYLVQEKSSHNGISIDAKGLFE